MSGDPYTLHTNVYTQGKGDKEQLLFSLSLIQIFDHLIIIGLEANSRVLSRFIIFQRFSSIESSASLVPTTILVAS
jgi:hypothetical protein